MSRCNQPNGLEYDECGNIVTSPSPASKLERVQNLSSLSKASKDKFILGVDIPLCVKQKTYSSARGCNAVKADDLLVSLVSVNVPAIKLGTTQLKYSGRSVAMPKHSRENEQIDVGFIIDDKYSNYWVLWQWAEFIASDAHGFAGRDSTRAISQQHDNSQVSLAQLSTTMSLYALDGFNSPVGEWVFKGCVLSSLDSIPFDYHGDEQIQCKFSFEYTFCGFHLH